MTPRPKTYKMLKNTSGTVISVPAEVGRSLIGRYFTFELTDEGMLYRPVDSPESAPVELPAWAKKS